MRSGAAWCATPARPSIRNWLPGCLAALALAGAGEAGAQEAQGPALPSFAELEAAGARIGVIRIDPQDMFDLDDPRENNPVYRFANKVHINTRPEVIRRMLLFKTGEPVSAQVVEETERLLRANRYLYNVVIRPIAYRDGVADIEVKTRDTWSLEPQIGISREGGTNSGRLSLEEDNFLGTGISVGIGYKSDVDRSGTTFRIADNNIFGSRLTTSYAYARLDDGTSQSFALERPFYALDTRWAAGTNAVASNGLDSVYNAGNVIAEYGHQRNAGELFGGWSPGLERGWTRRYSVGLSYEDNDYELVPGRAAPARLPSDLTLAGPFLRFELIEDKYRKDTNLNLIGRIEDVAMGFLSKLQLGRALSSFGSTRDLWLYNATLSNGAEMTRDSFLLTNASFSGRTDGGSSENQFLGGSARYYHRQGRHMLYFVTVSGDIAHDPDVPGPLLLGGDNGLRGYPLRYQSGEKRALMTLEARAYSDWYPLRLFRVGGAVFYDVGRAWGGENQNTVNPGWLSDVGFGLRIVNARTSRGSVLHFDFAFPLNPDPAIKSAQFLVNTKISF